MFKQKLLALALSELVVNKRSCLFLNKPSLPMVLPVVNSSLSACKKFVLVVIFKVFTVSILHHKPHSV
jgi:hypothetical protein